MIILGKCNLKEIGCKNEIKFSNRKQLPINDYRQQKERIGYGGARRNRTADLLHAMQTRYQLCYGPTFVSKKLAFIDSFVNLANKPRGVLKSIGK